MSSRQVRAFVDRIEGDRAFILVGEEGWEVVWPAEALPKDAREGSVVRVTIRLDDEATKQTEEVVDSLIERLRRGD